MKHEPVPYSPQSGKPAGIYYGSLSPDGWTSNWYQSGANGRMKPEELQEFIKLVSDFFHDIKEKAQLDAYARKYGRVLVPGALPTFGVTAQESLAVYDIHIAGCNVEFRPYPNRKES